MKSNAISKFSEDFLIESNHNSEQNSKMGLLDVKSVDSTANVINKVESNNTDMELTNILLVIIVVIMCANCFYKIYKLHNKCLKKRFMSQANDLDKI